MVESGGKISTEWVVRVGERGVREKRWQRRGGREDRREKGKHRNIKRLRM